MGGELGMKHWICSVLAGSRKTGWNRWRETGGRWTPREPQAVEHLRDAVRLDHHPGRACRCHRRLELRHQRPEAFLRRPQDPLPIMRPS